MSRATTATTYGINFTLLGVAFNVAGAVGQGTGSYPDAQQNQGGPASADTNEVQLKHETYGRVEAWANENLFGISSAAKSEIAGYVKSTTTLGHQ